MIACAITGLSYPWSNHVGEPGRMGHIGEREAGESPLHLLIESLSSSKVMEPSKRSNTS